MNKYAAFALELARECGDMARQHFSLRIDFEPKGDGSPVTMADKAINRHVIERCRQEYPEIDILGEEESVRDQQGRLLWVCDPIDGTTPYTFGASASTFCLALVDDGKPVVGVVYDFVNDRMFHAVVGQGAFLNGERIIQPKYKPMKIVNFEWWVGAAVPIQSPHEQFFARGYQVFNYASNSFMAMQATLGRIVGTVYMGSYSWDVAAAKVIAEESGMVVKNLDGDDQRYDGELRGAIMVRADYYNEVLEVVRSVRK